MQQNWLKKISYIFPSFSVATKVLREVQSDEIGTIVLIAPT